MRSILRLVLILAVSGAAGSCTSGRAFLRADEEPGTRTVTYSSFESMPSPLTFSEAQERLLSTPGIEGFVRARVESLVGTVRRPLPSGAFLVYTDFRIRVLGFVGGSSREQQYADGQILTLRIQGENESPRPEEYARGLGEVTVPIAGVVYLLVRDQGTFLGGNTGSRIVATLRGWDVYEARGGRVFSQQPGVEPSQDVPEYS